MGKTPAQEFKAALNKTKKLLAEDRKKLKAASKSDLAFGLKNKKGGKQKINVDRLRAQAAMAGRTKKEILADEKKKDLQRERNRLRKLGLTAEEELTGKKVVTTQSGMGKLAAGVDPKTVLCGYFKSGKCRKGKKCKFSHDLDIERKGKSKMSLYTDAREGDTMDKWNQDKLELVISKKRSNPNATSIVCNYFLEAIETKKYGWFWKCENGEHCLYQHKLPPGFVLKSDITKEEKDAGIDIYEQLELERSKLDISKCTPVTPENFAVWKEKKKKEKEEAMKKEAMEAMKNSKGPKKKGKHSSGMNGRSLFTFRPDLIEDDMDAAGDEDYKFEDEEEEDEKAETKIWKADAPVRDESEFLAALKLHEEGDENGAGDAAVGGDDAPAPAPAAAAAPAEEKPVEETEEEKAAIKKAKAEERARKRAEKKKAKLAAKLAKNVKVLTPFEKKKLGLA